MSTDPFGHDDAAYVLGALGPAERRAFEEHLVDCAACTRAVRDLAGLPGLLAQVDESAFTGLEDSLPVPDTLLPQLQARVRRQRRRTRLLTIAVAAAVALLVPMLLGLFFIDSGPTLPPAAAQTMTQIDQHQISATVSLQQVAWGTRMHLTCTYAPEDEPYEEPPSSYALIVHTRDGGIQQVATWRALPGRTTDLDAATDVNPDQITTVDVVRTGTGRRVLTLG
jgi:hypothetical protein